MCATSIMRITGYTGSHSFTWPVPRCNGTRLRMTMAGTAQCEKGMMAVWPVAKVVIPSG